VREIPILGRIAAGQPILAVENIEGTILFDRGMRRSEKLFFLRIKGESMKDAGIFDGDLVLLRQQPTAENGDIVAALVGDEEATVKRFRRRKDVVVLEPANPEFKPIVLKKEDSLTIIGKVLLSLRIVDGKFFQNIIMVH
jgi:repressor LexA